jgi:hypothetical protein
MPLSGETLGHVPDRTAGHRKPAAEFIPNFHHAAGNTFKVPVNRSYSSSSPPSGGNHR